MHLTFLQAFMFGVLLVGFIFCTCYAYYTWMLQRDELRFWRVEWQSDGEWVHLASFASASDADRYIVERQLDYPEVPFRKIAL